MKITKENMEALTYLRTCFVRQKITIDTGGYDDMTYTKAINAVLSMPGADEFTVVLPDGTEKRFVAQ